MMLAFLFLRKVLRNTKNISFPLMISQKVGVILYRLHLRYINRCKVKNLNKKQSKEINMKKLSLFALLLACASTLFAQRTETLFGRNSLGLTGIWGASTHNFSFYDGSDQGNSAYIQGGYGGLEFGRRIFVGWGGFRMNDFVDLENGAEDFTLRYNGPMISIAPLAEKVIHPRFGALFGSGRVKLSDNSSDKVIVIQPSLGMEINVLSWFRIGLEGGYRFVTNENIPNLDSEDISSPFAQVDFRFGISW